MRQTRPSEADKAGAAERHLEAEITALQELLRLRGLQGAALEGLDLDRLAVLLRQSDRLLAALEQRDPGLMTLRGLMAGMEEGPAGARLEALLKTAVGLLQASARDGEQAAARLRAELARLQEELAGIRAGAAALNAYSRRPGAAPLLVDLAP
ncbi:MAG: hypothetical protein HYY85_19005 [Deltaproteobacteria bacterium]|nr:hypothetical protein [Deltaproteobacteria bacterium]